MAYGAVFTRRWVADVLLDLTGYSADRDLGSLCLLEPACGAGAFLGPAVERLIASVRARGTELTSLRGAIRAFDLQDQHVAASRRLCTRLLTDAGATASEATGLARSWVNQADFLLANLRGLTVDVVVGNPPYIRYDDLAANIASEYRQAWSTMRGRGDIFVGFIERSLSMLKPGGRMGMICADRWMRNQYGSALRQLIGAHYSVDHVWTMHRVEAFEADVSAYPAITVISRGDQGQAVVANTTPEFDYQSAQAVMEWAESASTDFSGRGVKAHRMPEWFVGQTFWPTGSPARLALIERLNQQFQPLNDPDGTGTRVSIGVATGNDKAYITKDPAAAEEDRMLPLAVAADLRSGRFNWQGNYLVNPWTADGDLVDLQKYPRMERYLAQFPELALRHVAKRAPNRWYRTIDKVNSDLIDKPKLLLQDMKSHIDPVLEAGGHYPHHNLYHVVSDQWDLEVLGGLLLSRVAQAFVEAYCVRMRGDTLRFQAQYLKQIRVPNPATIDEPSCDGLKMAFRSRDVGLATKLAASVYGVDVDEYELGEEEVAQHSQDCRDVPKLITPRVRV
jgi:adenine-specific DNA-methyltransferase